ncbi:MAG: peroxide stress protein YaaA [Euryarchaeota archaeon]|nr:peroxide stress protein YaaA [Euryarchaeota archaeon]MBU4144127.1 peroxide stress protein YaaA [Candidatus Thermoplasmatota archaeon]
MAKALFLIPCCSRKNAGGESRTWNVVGGNNSLPFLNPHRDELINFYTNIPQNLAMNFYKMRGSGDERTRKVLKAWAKNRNIHQSETMMAINRYAGNLYSAIDWDIRRKMASGEIKNVLIVSALLGIISPTDLIPNYELMMGDKSPNRKVAKFWNSAFQSGSVKPHLDELFSQYDCIYCLMSSTTGYLDSVVEILAEHDAYFIVPNVSGQSNISKAWGFVLNDSLQGSISTPEEINRIAKSNYCDLINLRDRTL